ncbi:MAG: hypothetical protein AB7F74_11785 [Parvibaculaceae bacterium]
MRTILAALVLCLLAPAAQAEEASACAQFKWPLVIEKSWFGAGKLTELKSGAAVGEAADGAFNVVLEPSAGVGFVLPPEGKPKPGKPMGAVLSFGRVTTPGTYQVTLSDEAWIDVVQDGAYRPSLEFSGVQGCPGMRKSVRFAFKDAPLVLQLSSAAAASLALAIRRLPQ